MSGTQERIRWEPGQYGNLIGYVGKADHDWLFQIWRAGPGAPWQLDHALPGMTPRNTIGSENMLKATAEGWLQDYVAALGAVFTDGEG